MRIFFQCFVVLALVTACSSPTPTPSIRAVTLVPQTIEATEAEPSPSPSAIPAIVVCPDAPASRLIIQERGRSTADNEDPINLRNGPGISYDVVTRIETGEIFYVLDGASCAGGYAWFYVRYRRNGREYLGWIAEGNFENYFVEPYLQG